ncbi:exodeoxyribonuclease VII large subunit, partial [candidate division WOR-3 bacterium]|nr:exodeoxyribonuclease VII large subunit [candidate division WOR-3 bacterium]
LHSSGHFYTTLKDEFASIDAVIYRGSLKNLTITPNLGEEWICQGRLSLWEKTGRYIFVIDTAYPSGRGDLYLKFLMLKEKLQKEGLFDESRKKKLPLYPEEVGLVTSPTGAVLKDFINVYKRRFPVSRITLSPSSVQGAEAPSELVHALKRFWKTRVQVIVIARGGGSAEDLAPFNDEKLARAIADSPIPVVSAVGHETDRSISDFVSDLYAPTPSAAAELIFPDRRDLLTEIDSMKRALVTRTKDKTKYFKVMLASFRGSYSLNSVKGKLNELIGLSEYKKDSLVKAVFSIYQGKKLALENYNHRINPNTLVRLVESKKELFRLKSAELEKRMKSFVSLNSEKLNIEEKKLTALSPYVSLKKGYAIVFDSQGKLVPNGRLVVEDKSYDIKFTDRTWQMKAEKEKL